MANAIIRNLWRITVIRTRDHYKTLYRIFNDIFGSDYSALR